jgi:hypothetical protein
MQRAKDAFVILTDGMYRVVRKGEELEEDDPIVVENSGLFEPCVHAHLPTSPGGPTRERGMSNRRKVTATTTFVAITDEGFRTVHEGEQLDLSDEIVKANPSLFEGPVEQATAAPGEKRKR